MSPEETCNAHVNTTNSLEAIAASVKRLELAQGNTAEVQAEMAQSLAVMANTLGKIENANIAIERLNGKIEAMFDAFAKSEKEHDDIFDRLRALEKVGCSPRITKLEGRQDKQLWSGVALVGLALLATLIKLVWK